MTVVTLFFPELFHPVETMAYFLADAEDVRVRVVTSFQGNEKTEHPTSLGRIRGRSDIEVVAVDGEACTTDVLVFYLARSARISDKLKAWRAQAGSAIYLARSEAPYSWRDVAREAVRSFPHYLGARRIRFRPYIHPEFMRRADWLAASFAPIDADARRQWRLGFLGSRQPPERTRRLAQCREASAGAADRVKWHEYGSWESTGPRGIDQMAYMNVLSDMDFCLCPPGWDWYTHRTVEALVRGSIPVLDDPEVYGLKLVDGENCIVAPKHDWGEAVTRLLSLTEAEVRRIRSNVLALRQEYLLPERARDLFNAQLFARADGTLPKQAVRW